MAARPGNVSELNLAPQCVRFWCAQWILGSGVPMPKRDKAQRGSNWAFAFPIQWRFGFSKLYKNFNHLSCLYFWFLKFLCFWIPEKAALEISTSSIKIISFEIFELRTKSEALSKFVLMKKCDVLFKSDRREEACYCCHVVGLRERCY